jgi:hypothetical protein
MSVQLLSQHRCYQTVEQYVHIPQVGCAQALAGIPDGANLSVPAHLLR